VAKKCQANFAEERDGGAWLVHPSGARLPLLERGGSYVVQGYLFGEEVEFVMDSGAAVHVLSMTLVSGKKLAWKNSTVKVVAAGGHQLMNYGSVNLVSEFSGVVFPDGLQATKILTVLPALPVDAGSSDGVRDEALHAQDQSAITLTEVEMPSELEQTRHKLTHLPPKLWCPLCVKARSRDDPYFKQDRTEKYGESLTGVEVVQMDYTFVEVLKILTMYLVGRSLGAATMVQSKGAEDYAVSWAVKVLQVWQVEEVIIRTDQEPSIQAVAGQIRDRRAQSTTLQSVPRRSR